MIWSDRWGAFMVHGHYGAIYDITSENPLYPLSTYTLIAKPYCYLKGESEYDGEGNYVTTNFKLVFRGWNVFHDPPNMDDEYDRFVLPASLEGATVQIHLDGEDRDIGLESSAFVHGNPGQDCGSKVLGDGNKCYVKKITSRDGDVVGKEVVWYDHP